MTGTRSPAVAGMFYPENPGELKRTVTGLLENARQIEVPHPKALIVPHAGYIYSGPIAASAYALLKKQRGTIRRVILMGPAHRVYLKGLALPGTDRFAIPGGEIPLDIEAMKGLANLPQVTTSSGAHQQEHSLEVQLPFLREVLGDFLLVPLVVGEATPAEVAQVLDRLWGGEETLIVVSTDLSHYLPAGQARRTDRNTANTILKLDPRIDSLEACGASPVNGFLSIARKKGLHPVELDLRDSGNTTGDENRVVGYGAFAFYESPSRPSERDSENSGSAKQGPTLIRLARSAIASRLGRPSFPPSSGEGPWLEKPGASFVTLTHEGELRGCIGSLEAYRPLGVDVRANAVAAAFHDPRFMPLRENDLDVVRIEVSVLSPAEALQAKREDEVLSILRPGIDGVIFEYSRYRSTFLPQVWEQLPEPAQFLAHLKNKAGLPADFWAEGVRLSRYTVSKWKE